MKTIFTSKPILGLFLFAIFTVGAAGQCVDAPDDNCVSVRQSTLDKAMKAVGELVEARKVIEAQSKVTVASEVERAAYKNALEVSAAAIAIFQKGVADRDAIISLQDKALQAMAQLNEKLIQQMNKPKSAWSKFVNALKTVTSIAFGIGIGRSL